MGMCRIPYSPHQSGHVAEVNWTPLSEVMLVGTPKQATHVATKASRTASVVVSLSRTASGHLVDLSIMVSRWVKPSRDGGRGPTMSTCKWLNLAVGMSISSTVVVAAW